MSSEPQEVPWELRRKGIGDAGTDGVLHREGGRKDNGRGEGAGEAVVRAESPGDWGKSANWAHVEDTRTQGEGQVG